jgi:hypothetical protein
MDFKADIPNFLEPWYSIVSVANAFDINYIWNPGQAPTILPKFQTVDNALNTIPGQLRILKPVGKH